MSSPSPKRTKLAPSSSGRSRTWCATINNYDDSTYQQAVNVTGTSYHVIGKEVSATGTPHLQCYFKFTNAMRLSSLKTLLPTAHWEIARGSSIQNRDYCTKDGDFEERGAIPDATDIIKGMMPPLYHSIHSMMALHDLMQSLTATEKDIRWLPDIVDDLNRQLHELWDCFIEASKDHGDIQLRNMMDSNDICTCSDSDIMSDS